MHLFREVKLFCSICILKSMENLDIDHIKVAIKNCLEVC